MSYTEQEYRIATWLRIELKALHKAIQAGTVPADCLKKDGWCCLYTPGPGTWQDWAKQINPFLRSDKGKREFGDGYVVEYRSKQDCNRLFKRG